MTKPVVLVLGATGRIGQLLQLVPPEDLHLRLQARHPQEGQGGTWQVLDPLAEPAALIPAARGATAILCLAGPVPGRGRGEMQDHVALAETAVRAGAATGARVLLASSAAVYGAQAGLLAEAAPLRPANPYGQAKAEMETRAAALGAGLGVAVTALRIGNIAGFDAILGGWRPGFALDRFADGRSPRRSYIGPRSLARVLAALLAAPELPPVLNVAQPGPVDMAALLRAAGRPFAWQQAPADAIEEVALDCRRLQAYLPFALAAADPAQMAAEWAALEPHFTKESRR
jgi:UDP-glucose 4-epimerase